MNRYRYIAAINRHRSMAERDARPIEGILAGTALGLLFWAAVALIAAWL